MAGEATSQLSILVKVRDEASAVLNRLNSDISDLGGSLNFASLGAGALAGGMAAIAGAAILNVVKAFADSEQQMARFNTIMKTLPADLQKYSDQILRTADASMKLGFDNEAAAVSIARLFQTTRNAELAFQTFQVAMDLARYKGISLDEATQALILAFQGGGRMLKQLGIEVDEHASKQTILAAVMKATAGQAEAYAQTLNGARDIMRVYIGEVKEAMGLPFAEFIKSNVLQLKSWIDAQGGVNAMIDKYSTLLVIAGSLLTGVFVAGIIAATAAALTALGPFGLIVAAIMAIIGVGALIAASWGIVVDIFNRAADAVGRFVSATGKIAGGAWSSIKNVLGFAGGGIVTRPTLGLVGEAGPEAIIPLNRLGGMGGGINVYLQGDFYTTDEIAEKFANQIAQAIKLQVRV